MEVDFDEPPTFTLVTSTKSNFELIHAFAQQLQYSRLSRKDTESVRFEPLFVSLHELIRVIANDQLNDAAFHQARLTFFS